MRHQQTSIRIEDVQPAVPRKLLSFSKVVLAEKLTVCAIFYSAVPLPIFIFINSYIIEMGGVGGNEKMVQSMLWAH